MRRRPPTRASRLVVDPVACEGVGLCFHLAPRLVDLDRWGYPIVTDEPLAEVDLGPAARAVRGCPYRALAVIQADP
jgi:ferredoxin